MGIPEFVLFKDEIQDAISTTSVWEIEQYTKYIVKELWLDFEELIADTQGGILEDQATMNSIYEAIVEIYPEVSVDAFCSSFNENVQTQDAKRLIKSLGSPKSELFTVQKDVTKMKKALAKEVIGQSEAIESVVDGLKLLSTGLTSFPSFFFIGTTGVGKTELCKTLARQLFGSDRKLIKINCGEYSSAHEYAKLLGSPPGYVGHGETSVLTKKAEESSRWVILFDEIEKAHENIYDLLLNLLDEGTIDNSTGKTLNFKESIIVFTSNVGVNDFVGKTPLGFGTEETTFEGCQSEIQDSIDKKFPAEFRNRIDTWVTFNTLTKKDASRIATKIFRKYKVKPTKKCIDYVVDNSYSAKYGARNIERFIKNNVLIKLADSMLEVGVPKAPIYNFDFKYNGSSVEVNHTKKDES